MYDYVKEMTSSVYNRIKELYDPDTLRKKLSCRDTDEFINELTEKFYYVDETVTGSPCGYFTESKEIALGYLRGNEHLAEEAIDNFEIWDDVKDHANDPIWRDVLLRNYLLPIAVNNAFDMIEDELQRG